METVIFFIVNLLLFLNLLITVFILNSNTNILLQESLSNDNHNEEKPIADSISSQLGQIYGSFGIDISLINNKELFLRSTNWLGAEYRYGHLSPQGIDCSGFVKKVVSGLFVDTLFGGARHIYQKCMPIEKGMLKEGDLVFFKINKPYISHVGIYLQNNKFIHATTRRGVIISCLFEDYYQKYYYASGRLK